MTPEIGDSKPTGEPTPGEALTPTRKPVSTIGAEDPGRVPSDSEEEDKGGRKGIAWIVLVPIVLLGIWAVIVNVGRRR